MNRQRLPHPATFLPWLITALSLLWLKRDLLIEFPLHQVLLTETTINSTFFTDLACYRLDIPLLFGVIPIVLALLFYFLPRPLRLPLLVLICAPLEILVYAEGRSLMLVGQLSSFSMFLSAISWGSNGTGAKDYMPLSGVFKLAIAIGAVVVCALVAHFLTRGNPAPNSRLRQRVVVGYLALTLLVSVAAWLVPTPATPMTASVVSILGKSFFGLETVDNQTKGLQSASMDELIAKYRQLAQAPVSGKDPAFWGRARNENVILIVMETAPARYLDLAGDLSDYPNLARLREHSIVATSHESTYPYTNRAHVSIFTSLYPYAKKNFQSFPRQTLPGVISSLRSQGYETGAYGHLWTGETDANMYKSIGFDTIGVPPGGIDSGNVPWKQKIVIDRGALQMLESDIQKFNSNGKKFAVAFLPNVGHGPWPDMSDDGDKEDIPARGRGLMRLQDGWLGELLQVLEKNHMLSNTIIVITGDHGARDKVDDPSFKIGMLDEYSYHVPLMVYCPALPNRTDIPWITSHVDIAPTVLDLLGVDVGREMEEGAPMWQENLRGRTTFFLASHYMGADGYYRNQKYYMEKYLSNETYESPAFHFGGQLLTGAEADQVKGVTSELNALQAAMFYKYSINSK
jgi:lipoteichoic acid synthase